MNSNRGCCKCHSIRREFGILTAASLNVRPPSLLLGISGELELRLFLWVMGRLDRTCQDPGPISAPYPSLKCRRPCRSPRSPPVALKPQSQNRSLLPNARFGRGHEITTPVRGPTHNKHVSCELPPLNERVALCANPTTNGSSFLLGGRSTPGPLERGPPKVGKVVG